MLLIKLFSPPDNSSHLISLKLISPVDSFDGDESNTSSFRVEKGDSKPDIPLSNQNDDRDIHLIHPKPAYLKDPFQYSNVSSHYINLIASSDLSIGSSGNSQTSQANINNRNNTNVIGILSRNVSDDELTVNDDVDSSQDIGLILRRL
ncbi:15353_t:CDS:1 [Racocetra fulgida]|uniref:15353_t:CDS:1 n=1 Tax=Racocetra fulgida TaxID=60492 RepID=A0A9N9F7X0_9GLOM|nr:15353_t:CDS:1 [Racocetra fulgida]